MIMKELSIEEKAKAYDEAREKIAVRFGTNVAEEIFSEFEESEDERIRKGLINYFNHHKNGINIFYGIKGDDILAWLEKQGEPQDKGEISDGYHTFNELYYYRMLYNAAFFNMLPKEWVHKSKRHNDGEECFGGGWFIVMANLPTGQISNHYELKDWDLFQIPEKEVADKWDGHTPQKAADRLHKYLLEKQDEQKHAWSEEDEERLSDAIFFVREYQIPTRDKRLLNAAKETEDWLKSLKTRYTWKPSDAQIASITCAVRKMKESACYDSELVSLLNDLRKLKK